MADDGSLFAGMSLNADPDLPPDAYRVRSGDNRLRTVLRNTAEEMLWQRFKDDPEFNEEITSLTESKDFITYPREMTPPEKCEVCGTLVTFVPEEHVGRRGEPEPALWEAGKWRKHTPRRCKAMRRPGGG
jgi:hypothetical protein